MRLFYAIPFHGKIVRQAFRNRNQLGVRMQAEAARHLDRIAIESAQGLSAWQRRFQF